MSDAAIDSAGGPKAVVIGGATYLARPFSDEEFAALADWVGQRLSDPIKAIAADLAGLPPALQQAAIAEAVRLKAAGGTDPSPKAYRQAIYTPEGAAFVAYLAVRKEHPAVTHKEIAGAITAENMNDVLAEVGRAAGLVSLAGKATGA
jgi:hypothetical protein